MHMLVFALLFEHHAIPCTPCFPCADPGFFVRGGGGGGPGQSDKKSPDNVFFVLSFFTEVKWLISKKTIIFQGSRGGPTFSGGGFREGLGGPDPPPPWEITIYMGFFGHPHPLEKVEPPPPLCNKTIGSTL